MGCNASFCKELGGIVIPEADLRVDVLSERFSLHGRAWIELVAIVLLGVATLALPTV